MTDSSPNLAVTIIGFILAWIILAYLGSGLLVRSTSPHLPEVAEPGSMEGLDLLSEREIRLLSMAQSFDEGKGLGWVLDAGAFNPQPPDVPEIEDAVEPPPPPPPPPEPPPPPPPPPPPTTRERSYIYHGQILTSSGERLFYRSIDGRLEVVVDPSVGMEGWRFEEAAPESLTLIAPDGESRIFRLNESVTFVEPIPEQPSDGGSD